MYGGKVSSLSNDGKTLYIWEKFDQVNYPYVRIYLKNEKKNKLYKRVSITPNEKGNYIYEEASSLGDGMYAKEYRPVTSLSWIKGNRIAEKVTSPFKDILSSRSSDMNDLNWTKEDNNSEIPICKK
jgi:hypothetical protein